MNPGENQEPGLRGQDSLVLARLIPAGEPAEEYGYFGIIDASGQGALLSEYDETLSESASGD